MSNKEGFNKIVKRGAGRLADKDKREEYERLMRQKKTERLNRTTTTFAADTTPAVVTSSVDS